MPPRSPDRSSISQIPNPQMRNYTLPSQDYSPYYTGGETSKRQRTSMDLGTPPIPSRSPDRSSIIQMPNPQIGNYPLSSSRDYSTYYNGTGTPKAQHTPVDLGTQGLYDRDGRYTGRQMDAYQPQVTNPYQGQATYPTRMVQGFPPDFSPLRR